MSDALDVLKSVKTEADKTPSRGFTPGRSFDERYLIESILGLADRIAVLEAEVKALKLKP